MICDLCYNSCQSGVEIKNEEHGISVNACMMCHDTALSLVVHKSHMESLKKSGIVEVEELKVEMVSQHLLNSAFDFSDSDFTEGN